MSTATAVPRWTPENLAALGRQLEGIAWPLCAMVERLSNPERRVDYRGMEQADRAHEVARFTAKELQELIRSEDDGPGVLPAQVESELLRAETLIAAINCMAALVNDVSRADVPREFPPDDGRWTFIPSRREILASMEGLASELEQLAAGAAGRWRGTDR